jgi:hypothetical protein
VQEREWARRGVRQEAYQIIVRTNEGTSDVVWDSGRVASSEVAHQRYQGPPLRSLTPYQWQVRQPPPPKVVAAAAYIS